MGNECYRFILRAGWIFNVAKHKTSLDGKYANIVERELFSAIECDYLECKKRIHETKIRDILDFNEDL